MAHWADEPKHQAVKDLARQLAIFHGGNADLLATKMMPKFVRGDIRLVDSDIKQAVPLWYFFIDEAYAVTRGQG